MAKIKNDYFKLIEQQVEYCVQASDFLTEFLSDYTPAKIAEQREKMHAIEHAADILHHDILTRLTAEFITPIDQDDILRLVQIIDDVTDALDEVVLDFFMYHIDQVPAHALETSRIVNRCVKALYAAAKELRNFKKPDTLRPLLVEVNNMESEADTAYIHAIHQLFAADVPQKALLAHKEVYESFEECCDLCEHAADVIEQIIIKNT